MHGKLISVIYFYLVSIIALVLCIIGVFHIISFTINITQFDKYPLQYGEDRCTMVFAPLEPKLQAEEATLSAQKTKDCLTQLDMERKQRKVNDMKNAITFPLLGVFLFALHFPIALRRSKN